jgi:tetratricopeptide (TPR) repeat protein
MASAATLGLAQCDEAQVKLEAALKAYENFAKTETNSFLYAQSVFGRGRCLEQMGRYDDARTIYEDFIAAHPKDPWTPRAETALMYVKKAKRAAEKVKPAAMQISTPAPVMATPVAAPAK